MEGIIKTYLPEKKYGFLKGDDGKDYFFHESSFKTDSDKTNLCEEAAVKFEQQATPKGYKAYNCNLVSKEAISTYVVPDDFITSKSADIKGWEIIVIGD